MNSNQHLKVMKIKFKRAKVSVSNSIIVKACDLLRFIEIDLISDLLRP